jgi:hypothetical protein
MAATLQQIRQGIATNLGTLADAPQGIQISAYILDNPSPPCLYVMGADEITYDLAMQRGLDQWRIVIQGFVGGVTDIGAQVRLDEWLAPTGDDSVKQAIESDKTLGGLIADISVVSSSGYRLYHVESQAATLGADWVCSIYNTGI